MLRWDHAFRAGCDARSFQKKGRRFSKGLEIDLLAQVVSMKRCWQLLEGCLQEHIPAPKKAIRCISIGLADG